MNPIKCQHVLSLCRWAVKAFDNSPLLWLAPAALLRLYLCCSLWCGTWETFMFEAELAGTVGSSTNICPGSWTVCIAAQTSMEAVTCCCWPSSQQCPTCHETHVQLQSIPLACSEGAEGSPSLISLGKGKSAIECRLANMMNCTCGYKGVLHPYAFSPCPQERKQ